MILMYLISLSSYISWLPTIPVYPDSREAYNVLKAIQHRSFDDELFYLKTDPSVVHAFVDVVPLSFKEMQNYINDIRITSIILFFKYTINRPRPHQILSTIHPMKSTTADTPSFPAGHAFQAYYLAYMLQDRYPHLKQQLWEIATKCDDVRVKAGLHYPSDGRFSRQIVDVMKKIGLI
jgi:hypothetical protein